MSTALVGFHLNSVRDAVTPLPLPLRPIHLGRSKAGMFWLFRFDNHHGAHVSCRHVNGYYDVVHCVFPGTGPQWHCVHHETHRLDITTLADMLEAIKEGTWTPNSWTCTRKT